MEKLSNVCRLDRVEAPPAISEPLEGRCLMSAALILPPDAPAPAQPPTVRVLTRPLVTGGTAHTFQLLVSSGAGLSADAVGGEGVLVTGPNRFSSGVTVTHVVAGEDKTRLLVTCRVAAPGGSFDGADNGVYRVALREGSIKDEAGTPAPAGVVGAFRVAARRALYRPAAAEPVLPLGPSATAGALTAELSQVYAYTDRMPVIMPGERRQYLILTTTLTNTSDAPLEVRLDRGYLSFDAGQIGEPTDGISLRGASGRPSGAKSIILHPGERRTVQFRGDGLFADERAGQRLYVTLEFSAGGSTAFVRNSAVVGVTY